MQNITWFIFISVFSESLQSFDDNKSHVMIFLMHAYASTLFVQKKNLHNLHNSCITLRTRSSAVAKRPRDASCLSVELRCVNSTIPQEQFLYFSFGFTSAYNSILFCCLRRNVKLCCHTHDLSWLCIVRERAWSLSRWRTTETVTLSHVHGACMVVEYPQYDQRYNCHNLRDGGRRPLATMFTTPRRDFCLPYLYSTPPLGRFPSEYRHPVWYGKTRMVWLPEGEKISKISLFVLTPLMNVTDTQTDTHTHTHRHCMTA